jgi:hypothetical protein
MSNKQNETNQASQASSNKVSQASSNKVSQASQPSSSPCDLSFDGQEIEVRLQQFNSALDVLSAGRSSNANLGSFMYQIYLSKDYSVVPSSLQIAATLAYNQKVKGFFDAQFFAGLSVVSLVHEKGDLTSFLDEIAKTVTKRDGDSESVYRGALLMKFASQAKTIGKVMPIVRASGMAFEREIEERLTQPQEQNEAQPES